MSIELITLSMSVKEWCAFCADIEDGTLTDDKCNPKYQGWRLRFFNLGLSAKDLSAAITYESTTPEEKSI